MNAARRLVFGLIAVQMFVGLVTAMIVGALAPRLLLLEAAVLDASVPLVLWGSGAVFALVIAATLVLTAGVRPALRDLSRGQATVLPVFVLDLYAIPARLVVADFVIGLLVSLATLLPPLRPRNNNLFTQVELVLLTMTMVSGAALPGYVMMRSQVSRVLELVAPQSAREALDLLEIGSRLFATPRAERRIHQRLFLAIAGPVAFVALGASLLVHAHLRYFDTSAREDAAEKLARGILDRVGGSVAGREEAIVEASEKKHGYVVELSPGNEPERIVHTQRGETRVIEPLEDGHASVTFRTARLGAETFGYVVFAVIATAIAGFFGLRLGRAFASDVALATRQVRAMGAADVIRGTRILGNPRFHSVSALTRAIDELGGLFREFAEAQERAIDARAATERMRGLFLASMSHDLKAPLNAILGFAELVSRGDLTDAQLENVVIIEQRGRELLYLINTILDVARVEAGELSIVPEWTKVGDVVMSAVNDARELLVGLDVQVVAEIQPGVPRLLVDPPRIAQAVTAVVLVAARFAEHGIVRIRATAPAAGEQLKVDVEATGRGLPDAERERLFQAFKFAGGARRHGSLGLGPSLARSLLAMHGGAIDVETTESGGILFRLWLPTERMSSRSASIAPPPPSSVR